MKYTRLASIVLCLCFTTCVAVTARAQSDLAPSVWKEYAYGMQLSLPLDVQQTWPTQRGTASFAGRDCLVFLFLQPHIGYEKQSATPGDAAPGSLEALLDQSWLAMGFAADERVALSENDTRIADRPAKRSAYVVTEKQTQTPQYIDQGLFKIDRFTAACLWVVTDDTNRATAEKLAGELIEGLSLMEPTQIDTERSLRLEAGDRFIKTFNRKLLEMDLPFEQHYRISNGDKEVGGVHYLQDFAPPERGASLIVRRRGRIVSDTGKLDFDEEFSQSLDGKRELWQRRATDTATVAINAASPMRRARPQGGPVIHTDETGAASGERVAVSRMARAKQKNPVWQLPPVAYLSQTDSHLLLRRLPRQDAEFAFYAYDTQTGQIKLMNVRVETQLGGRYTATIHRRPESLPEVWTFDRSGNLLSQILPNGNMLTPCEPSDLESIWTGFDLRD